jgi:TolB-like protein/Tfp pilus assembly protein PilF
VPAATAAADGFAFGEFVLEPLRRLVFRRDGVPVALTPRVFNALQLFVAHPGELLDKDWLMETLWPGLVVEENSLSQVVSALRRVLGDGRAKRYILTEPRRGFRFVTDVAPWHQPRPSGSEAPSVETVQQAASAGARSTAIAVLPFVSLTADGRDDLLEVGMADSLIARLSAVPGLVLRSIHSVRRFAGLDQDALAAAQALDAGWVVEGSLQRRGPQLRVSARLLSVPNGLAAWSGSFDETIADVFDVQDAIADRVAKALALHLKSAAVTPHALPASAGGGTRDVVAYQHYLAGLAMMQGVRGDHLRQAAAEFDEAVAIDPNYALARVLKAEAYRRMVFGADSPPVEVLTPSRQWVLQALAVAPDLAEAHCQLAWILSWYDHNWAEAAREFRQALALKPSLAHAHYGLGLLLLTLGRIDEGLEHSRLACELDPMGLIYNAQYSCALAHSGDLEAGKARLKWVLEVDPGFWVGHMAAGRLHVLASQPGEAITALQRAVGLCGGQSTQATAVLGAVCASAGRHDEARAVLSGLEQRASQRFVPPTSLAAVLVGLGEREAALAQLERAVVVHDTRLVYLKDDWRWESLRGEARFLALLAHLKLDGYGRGLIAT